MTKRMHLAPRLAGLLVAALTGVLGACQSAPSTPERVAAVAPVPGPSSAEALAQTYHLGPGDRLRVTVFQEPDLSGEFDIDPSGQVALPLIDAINAAGMTIPEFQKTVTRRLSDGYIVNPRVSVDVMNYRPFYITGEVNRPGEYPYVAGMNILKAVAMAGGYTYRANTDRVFMTRINAKDELVLEPKPEVVVLPGDFIRVPERFF